MLKTFVQLRLSLVSHTSYTYTYLKRYDDEPKEARLKYTCDQTCSYEYVIPETQLHNEEQGRRLRLNSVAVDHRCAR